MFMCVVNQKPVNKLDLTWKQSFLINASKVESGIGLDRYPESCLVTLNKGAAMIAKF
jgi:hypothetical protein